MDFEEEKKRSGVGVEEDSVERAARYGQKS